MTALSESKVVPRASLGVRTTTAPLTRSLVLDIIRSQERVSRVELADLTGFTEATISTTVRSMISDGLVSEVGHSESTGGKRRRLLSINPRMYFSVGLSLDRERLSYVITDLNGAVVSNVISPGAYDDEPAKVVERIAEEVGDLIADSDVDASRVVGLGVASPGPLDGAAGTLRGARPSPAWNGFPLRDLLQEATGLVVVTENDATCAALGEHWIRRTPAVPASATVYMADGIGAGILIDGSVYRGASTNAGEIGHISLDINGPVCTCGARGCVEVMAGPKAVVTSAQADRALDERLRLSSTSVRQGYARIVREAARGDEACIHLLQTSAQYLAAGVLALANLFDLNEVVLSGPGLVGASALYSAAIREQLDAHAFARDVHPVAVSISSIRSQAAAIGAATIVMQSQVTPHAALGIRRRTTFSPGRPGA